jgi:lysophospholipase L1-like esterase
MRRYLLSVLLACSFTIVSYSQVSAQQKLNMLPAADLNAFGRFDYDKQHGLELISSAVHFGFSVEGDSVRIDATIPDQNGHNYIQYELDGKYQKRLRVSGNSTAGLVIRFAAGGRHKLWIYKATEAHTGPIFIKSVSGKNIKSLSVANEPLIEFIGNSITCGAAADPSEIPCGTGEYHDQHNAYMAYGPRLARALHANFILSSVSGIGIYRNWNSDGPVMPQVYEKTDFQEQSARSWDFTRYSPKVVSIALGTNDFSNGDGKTPRKPFDPKAFVSGYVNFIKVVKSKYPKARIALLSSPMVRAGSAKILENCLKEVKEQIDAAYPKDRAVQTFFFKAMDAHGCAGHPDVQDHYLMAQQLKPFFQKLIAN